MKVGSNPVEDREMGEQTKNVKQGSEPQRAVAGWRPFGDLEAWERDSFPRRFGSLFEELLRDWPAARSARGFMPAVDLVEGDGQYTISVELPGMGKDDVHVEAHQGVLTVRGEKKSERDETRDRRRYIERSYGSFSRSFTLPPDADADRLSASFKDGVLTITMPRSEEAKPRQIAIKTQ
jgi:HSP20 family protein